MLVLSRKETETILIGDDVIVTIQAIKGNRVSISVEAPRQVKVLRGELPRSRHPQKSKTKKVN